MGIFVKKDFALFDFRNCANGGMFFVWKDKMNSLGDGGISRVYLCILSLKSASENGEYLAIDSEEYKLRTGV